MEANSVVFKLFPGVVARASASDGPVRGVCRRRRVTLLVYNRWLFLTIRRCPTVATFSHFCTPMFAPWRVGGGAEVEQQQ